MKNRSRPHLANLKRQILRKSIAQNPQNEVLTRKRTLGVGLQNIRGKTDQTIEDLKIVVTRLDLDVLCLVETHIRAEDKVGVELEGFDTHESLREGEEKKGGGLAILTRRKDGIVFSRHRPNIKMGKLAYVDKERLWVTYKSKNEKTAICCVYLACENQNKLHVSWNSGIVEVLTEEIFDLRGKGFRIILQGDFNSWVGSNIDNGGIPGNRAKVNGNGVTFKKFLEENNLLHVNGACRTKGDLSTRICTGLWTRHGPDYVTSSVIDYVVVSQEHLDSVTDMMVDQHGVHGGDSDHNLIVSRFKDEFVSVTRSTRGVVKEGWDLNDDVDWGKYQDLVEEEVNLMTSDNGSVESLSHKISGILHRSMEKVVGRRKTVDKSVQKLLPQHLVKLVKERRQLENNWKHEKVKFANSLCSLPTSSLLVAGDKLKQKNDEVRDALITYKRQLRAPIKSLCKRKTKRGSQMFWQYVSRKPRGGLGITALQNKRTGVLHCKPEEVCEEVSTFLEEMFASKSSENEDETDDVAREQACSDHIYAQSLPKSSTIDDHGYSETVRPHLTSKDDSKLPGPDPTGRVLQREVLLKN